MSAAFEVRNGCFGYPHGRQVLKNVSFAVQKGEMLAILGPNGAGKTTMLRCMMGFLKWTSGQSLLDGEDIAGMSVVQSFGAEEETREIFVKIAISHTSNCIYAINFCLY